MHHPFELELSDLEALNLDLEEELTEEETSKVRGGILPRTGVTTQALGEEGGWTKPPIYTTMAIGEEGGFLL